MKLGINVEDNSYLSVVCFLISSFLFILKSHMNDPNFEIRQEYKFWS